MIHFVADRVAVKLIDKTKLDAKTQRMLVREIQIMDKLAHPCLIRYLNHGRLHIFLQMGEFTQPVTKNYARPAHRSADGSVEASSLLVNGEASFPQLPPTHSINAFTLAQQLSTNKLREGVRRFTADWLSTFQKDL